MHTLRSKILITISVIVIFALLFGWFQIRPSVIKSECGKKTSVQANTAWEDKEIESYSEIDKYYDMIYDNCLHKAGL
jgi:hypothetical protein